MIKILMVIFEEELWCALKEYPASRNRYIFPWRIRHEDADSYLYAYSYGQYSDLIVVC